MAFTGRIDLNLSEKLRTLAEKYEVASFTDEDPSQFLRWYKTDTASIADIECASFLAAMLAFGNRKQFIPKIRLILETADSSSSSISCWLKTGDYRKSFESCNPATGLSDNGNRAAGEEKFYRFYSYDDMCDLFEQMANILNESADGTLGSFFKKEWEHTNADLADIIGMSFPKAKIVPKGKTSANKRIYMFLRWMVRQNSTVDLGLWSWYPQSRLLIPLDTHVMQEAVKLGLLPENSTASRKTSRLLTERMAQVFPDDPSRSDFALFGLGVDTSGMDTTD